MMSRLSRVLRDPLPQCNPSRSFRLWNPGDGVHNGNVKRVVDSQRSSLSFGIGRAELVSVDVNLWGWNVRMEGQGGWALSPSLSFSAVELHFIHLPPFSRADIPRTRDSRSRARRRRSGWNQNTPQGLSVDYNRSHALLMIMTIVRVTFDSTSNSISSSPFIDPISENAI